MFVALLSLARVYETRQKAPLVVAFLMFTMLVAATKRGGLAQSQQIGKTGWLIGCATVFMGTLLYVFNFGLTFANALWSVFARLLLIPSVTETNFFAVFPNLLHFRGLAYLAYIRLRPLGVSSDNTIYDVSYYATGQLFSSNASFLAVGWSANGFVGVIFVSTILVGLLLLLDYNLRYVNRELFLVAIGFSLPSINGIVSGSLLDFITWGGVITPGLMLAVHWWSQEKSGFRIQNHLRPGIRV